MEGQVLGGEVPGCGAARGAAAQPREGVLVWEGVWKGLYPGWALRDKEGGVSEAKQMDTPGSMCVQGCG